MAQPTLVSFTANTGAQIFQIPLVVFPNGFVAYSYLILGHGGPTLVDCGSGFGESDAQLVAGLNAIPEQFGIAFALKDIERVFITHGHIDHFGGVAHIAELAEAAVGVNQLDRRVLTNYEERVVVASKDLRVYLDRAGIRAERRQNLMEMYGFAKKHVRSVPVGFHLDEDDPIDGMEFIHTPGHCPGQVCIRIGDVLLSADHVLSHTTPHQAPESITHYTGLGHYLDSLRKIAKVGGIRLALGGHEEPITEFYDRIEQIKASHDRKLNRVLDLMRDAGKPMTISEISRAMYPDKHGYDVLLALEEAGAHIEYLYQHAALSVANLQTLEMEENPALEYVLT